MLRYAVLGVAGLIAGSAWAQQTLPQAGAPDPSSSDTQPSKTVALMEEPMPGDHWTYEVRDEISGTITASRLNTVTEVTPTEISTRVNTLGKSVPGQIVFDRSWNTVILGDWKYSPNDGNGIQMPLTVGKSWAVQSNYVNGAKGYTWKRSGTSRVVGQETVTTKAGTFETFKIETSYTDRNVNNPSVKNEGASVTWYAPAIDHWVKRTYVSRANNRLLISNAIELTDYGRKQ
jgi:hypothetical protein